MSKFRKDVQMFAKTSFQTVEQISGKISEFYQSFIFLGKFFLERLATSGPKSQTCTQRYPPGQAITR